MRFLNNRYVITVSTPLLRPGLVISTEVSSKYVIEVVGDIMEMVRAINAPESGKVTP